MIAIRYHRFGGPEELRTEDIPTPIPGSGQVRIAMRAVGVIPLDWKMRAGLLQAHFTTPFPKVPGREGAGVIDAVGPGVTDLAVGDGVCVTASPSSQGTYAGQVVADRADVVGMPDSLRFDEAAGLLHAGVCALTCLAEVGAGQEVLIHGGAGAIGGMAVQLARHLGAHVTATCRAVNAEYVLGLGADRVIAYDQEDFSVVCQGMDVVIDTIGGEVHRRSYGVLRPGGRLVCLIAAPFVDRSAEHGVRLVRAPIRETPGLLQQVVALAEAGVWRPAVRAVLPLRNAAGAHRMMEAGEVTRGRLVLAVD